jgi:uncharacterized protein YlxP (DUF503 family)
VGYQEKWQRTELGFAAVGGTSGHVRVEVLEMSSGSVRSDA